ncbi:hypothetical protein AB8615_00890 [Litorimonas sp. RW-G-Af-16]
MTEPSAEDNPPAVSAPVQPSTLEDILSQAETSLDAIKNAPTSQDSENMTDPKRPPRETPKPTPDIPQDVTPDAPNPIPQEVIDPAPPTDIPNDIGTEREGDPKPEF